MRSNTNFQEETDTGSGQIPWRSENYMLHGILGPENQHQHPGFENYGTMSYGLTVPQFLRVAPQKQQPQSHTGQLQFSNNAPFWNATCGTAMVANVRPSLVPPVQPQFPTPSFNEKPKV